MSTKLRLENRLAVVTGASAGIGRAVALAFAEEGADVVAHYWRSVESAEAVVREITARGRRALATQADLSRVADISALARSTLDRFGRIDIWANIAGADILTGAGTAQSDIEKLDRLIATDLRGTVLCSWAAVDAMGEEGGVIINMSWDQALSGMRGREAELFAAVKGGIISFSKSLARSVAPRTRVNVLAPGWIATAFSGSLDEATRRRIADSIPLKRWGTPDDVARAAVYLASPDSAYLTGQVLLVGGGEVM